MGNKLHFFHFALLFLFARIAFGQSSPETVHYDTEKGLANNQVRSILQDSKGFIWIGTANGLNRFDAYEFETFEADPTNKNALDDNTILAIHEDSQGFIWLGTNSGGLNRYNPKTGIFKSWKTGTSEISDNTVYSIASDNNGMIWVGTKKGGLNKFNPETEEFVAFVFDKNNENSLPSNYVWELLWDEKHDCLWIGTGRGLARMNEEGKFENITYGNEEEQASIASLFLLGDQLWVGTWNFGFYQLNINSNKIINAYDEEDGLPNSSILGISSKNGTNIWLASYGSGLVHFDSNKKTFKKFLQRNVQENTNWTMTADSNGNLWCGSFGGLLHYQIASEKGFNLYDKERLGEKLNSESISAVSGNSLDKIWVGTLQGLNRISLNSSYEVKEILPIVPPQITSALIRGVHETENGEVWVATWGGGVDKLTFSENGEVKSTKSFVYTGNRGITEEIASNQILSSYLDSQERLWIGSLGGLNRLNTKDESIEYYYASRDDTNSLSDSYVYAIYETKDGKIWAGTAQGLDKWSGEGNKFDIFRHNLIDRKSLSHNKVISMLEDEKGNFWIGTDGGGLNLMNREEGTFTVYNEKNGLSGNSVKGIAEADDGTLWISTNKGLSNLDPTDKTFKNYDVTDGLQGNDFAKSSTISFPSGHILVGGANGFNIFLPSALKVNEHVPQVAITSFKLFGNEVLIGNDSSNSESPLRKNIAYTNEINLTYEDKIIEFGFTGLNYVKSDKNEYRYKMEGFETDWRYANSNRRFASYTNLPSGKKYTFRVQASNNDGKWNEEGASVVLNIKPPFWETWWFRISILALVGLGVFAFFKARTASLEAQKAKLEQQVSERTAELRKKQQEILVQNEDLQVKQEEILTQNEELSQQQEEISAQRDNIEEKNKVLLVQKDEIEKSHKNIQILTDIGQEITSILDLPTIIMKTYESVNELMDASGFGIGIYDKEDGSITFKGYIEKGVVLPTHKNEFDPENDLGSWSIKTRKEVFINDLETEYQKYLFGKEVDVVEGDVPQSLIYLPLVLHDRDIGAITVQSFDKNAYTEKDITLLRSLATYVSIAVDNAESYRNVTKSNEVIKAKNKDIMDSLRYAETIQKSVLPTKKTINNFVENHFVIFKPKDVVSGDFYWLREVDGYVFCAVVDCTGHGVPGAFMSLIGNELLDTIITREKVFSPAKILELMHEGVRFTLQQDKQLNSDGMDVALCMMEQNENGTKITFAGAKRPIFYTENGVFKEQKGDRKSVGGFQRENSPKFENIELQLAKGDMIYLTSDGFVDQNSPTGKKYGTKKFRSVLANICQLDIELQEECLRNELHTHQQMQSQRDDISVFGVQV